MYMKFYKYKINGGGGVGEEAMAPLSTLRSAGGKAYLDTFTTNILYLVALKAPVIKFRLFSMMPLISYIVG